MLLIFIEPNILANVENLPPSLHYICIHLPYKEFELNTLDHNMLQQLVLVQITVKDTI